MASFATPAYFVNCYDGRPVRENLSDNNTPVTGSLDANPILLQLLSESTALILSVCEEGERYNEADLFALVVPIGTDINNNPIYTSGASVLLRLNCDLAYGLLFARRGRSTADVDRQCPRYGQALMQLEKLRLGAAIIPGVDGAADAGLPGLGNTIPSTNPYNPITYSQLAYPLFPASPCRPPFNYPGGCGY